MLKSEFAYNEKEDKKVTTNSSSLFKEPNGIKRLAIFTKFESGFRLKEKEQAVFGKQVLLKGKFNAFTGTKVQPAELISDIRLFLLVLHSYLEGMHGFIFIEFEKFALTKVPFKVWDKILAENQLQDRLYSPVSLYSDSELVALLTSVSARTHLPAPKLLEQFGTYLVPDLMKVYRAYINPEWKTLEMLENAEISIHVAVRKSTAGAAPPILDVRRVSHNELEIHYISERKMVELGVGIIKGIAAEYGESDNFEIDLEKFEAEGRSVIHIRQLF